MDAHAADDHLPDVELSLVVRSLSYDVGNEYLDALFRFLNEERDVHQDCIKNFCSLVRAFSSECKLPFLDYVIIQKQGALLYKILPHLSNIRFEFLLRMFLKDIQVKESQYSEFDKSWMAKMGEDHDGEETDDEKAKSKSQLTQQEQALTEALEKLKSDVILKLIKYLHSSSGGLN